MILLRGSALVGSSFSLAGDEIYNLDIGVSSRAPDRNFPPAAEKRERIEKPWLRVALISAFGGGEGEQNSRRTSYRRRAIKRTANAQTRAQMSSLINPVHCREADD